MIVVAYSDASFKNSKGTWAGCVTLDNTLVVEYEEKIDKCHSVDFAELYGVSRLLEEIPMIWNIKVTLKVLTDSMSTVKWFNSHKEPRHKTTRILYSKVLSLLENRDNFEFVEINYINRNSSNYYFKNCHSRAKTLNT